VKEHSQLEFEGDYEFELWNSTLARLQSLVPTSQVSATGFIVVDDTQTRGNLVGFVSQKVGVSKTGLEEYNEVVNLLSGEIEWLKPVIQILNRCVVLCDSCVLVFNDVTQ